jgi:hypothetical protein
MARFGLRRVALYRTHDHQELNRARLQSGVGLRSCPQVGPDNNGKNIRPWTGMSFAYHVLDMYEKRLECCSKALESDRSNPKLWLTYSAGRDDEALCNLDDA